MFVSGVSRRHVNSADVMLENVTLSDPNFLLKLKPYGMEERQCFYVKQKNNTVEAIRITDNP